MCEVLSSEQADRLLAMLDVIIERPPTHYRHSDPATAKILHVAVVSTSSSTSPATSAEASTTNPSRPSNATLAGALPCCSTRGLLDLRTWSSQIVRPRARLQAEADARVVTRSPPLETRSPFPPNGGSPDLDRLRSIYSKWGVEIVS
jgi:hypothetical protein